jgi:hypothetical protein
MRAFWLGVLMIVTANLIVLVLIQLGSAVIQK